MGFDDEGGFYGEEYRWERNGQLWGCPPLFYSNGSEAPAPTEQAANCAAALLHSAIECIGAIPVKSDRSGDPLDADLASFLATYSGVESSTIRAGLMLIRSDGYQLVKVWTTHDEQHGWSEGRERVWPTSAEEVDAG